MEKKFKVITIILFLIILFGTGIFTVLDGGQKYSVFEKRKLASFPKTNVQTVTKGKFQKGLDKFLNDHVLFRDGCVYTTTIVDRLMGRAEKANVYFGKDGYLIEKSEKVKPKDVKHNVDGLTEFVNMVGDSGMCENVKVVMIPSKEYVLTDKLPSYAQVSDENIKMKQYLWNKLSDKDTFVDLTKTLQKHKDEYIYYKTDHHWTSLGAKYGYQEIMNKMGNKPVKAIKSKVVCDDFLGTTYNKIHYAPQKDVITKYDIKTANGCRLMYVPEKGGAISDTIYDESALKKDDKYEYFMGGNYGEIKIHTGCKNGKTLVLIKDSFANCMIPFLTSNYENIVMVDLRYINDNVSDICAEVLDETGNIDSFVALFNEDKFMEDNHIDMMQ